MSDRAKLTEDAERIEIPAEYLPEGVSSSSMDPVVMRAAAEAHVRHRFDHTMEVKAWTVLYLLDKLSLVASLEQQLRVANENVRVREESQIPMIPRAAHAKMERLERKLAERDEALREMREALEAISEVASVAHNGDPWYCENEGIDAEAAFTKVRAALARESEEQ